MGTAPRSEVSLRSDAPRDRARILDAACLVFTEAASAASPDMTPPEQSMAEVARRAGVGATLYRNFPGRRELLEALFAKQVEALIAAAVPSDDPRTALLGWLHRFAEFEGSKHASPVSSSSTRNPQTRYSEAAASA